MASVVILVALAGPTPSSAGGEKAAPATAQVSIQVSFKLDPRLSGPTYGGEHWVSPPAYTGASAQDTVEARARAMDASGKPSNLALDWIPADPEMVSVTPAHGDQVKIAVKRAGESKLKIASQGGSKELLIKARQVGKTLQIEIVQLGAGPESRSTSLEMTQRMQSALAAAPQERKALAGANRKAGEAFLAENKRREGVVTLPDGLQYKVLERGQGKTPTDADTVTFNYRGTLLGGAEFASSRRLGRPATVKLTRAIPGFREALKLMPAGSKWQIFIPPQLAYGVRGLAGKKGSGLKIGPNATLIFEVELLAIGTSPAPGEARTPTVITATSKPQEK